MSTAERLGAAGPAEQVMDRAAAELIVGEMILALQQPQGRCLDQRLPEALLGADRAVALAGALGEVEIAFEPHRAAMAAAVIGLRHAGAFSLKVCSCASSARPKAGRASQRRR